MSTNQIRLHAKPYNGKNPTRQSAYLAEVEMANKLEVYLTSKQHPDREVVLDYYSIISDIGYTKEAVMEILFRYSGGSNGIRLPPRDQPPE